MIKKKTAKRRALAHEILGLTGISALLALVLFLLLSGGATAALEEYYFNTEIVMTELDWMELDQWVFGVSMVIAVCFFSILFLALLADRMAYIRTITRGIGALGQQGAEPLPLVGCNELTELAGAVNAVHQAQQQLRRQEQALAEEKEQFIRTLSHDIRTPLTSILAYSDYLSTAQLPPEAQREQLQLIRKKAEQIKDLTDLLLDGGKRNLEHFADARLLMEQLAAEFTEGLEEEFCVRTDLSGCPAFDAAFDVQELRRIFDNLSSNVQKYADPAQPVALDIRVEGAQLMICQRNAVTENAAPSDSYGLGIRSIRRIAQGYGGQVTAAQAAGSFAVTVSLGLAGENP